MALEQGCHVMSYSICNVYCMICKPFVSYCDIHGGAVEPVCAILHLSGHINVIDIVIDKGNNSNIYIIQLC